MEDKKTLKNYLELEDFQYIFKDDKILVKDLEDAFKPETTIQTLEDEQLSKNEIEIVKFYLNLKEKVVESSQSMRNSNLNKLRKYFDHKDFEKTTRDFENEFNPNLYRKLESMLRSKISNDKYLASESNHLSNESKNLISGMRLREEPKSSENGNSIFESHTKKEEFNPEYEVLESDNLKQLWIPNIKQLFDIENGKKIGKGGQGTVYLVNDGKESVAVKTIKQSIPLEKCFLRECNIMAEFSNPNITKIKGYSRTNENFYIVMEYAPNGSLKQFLKNNSPKNLAFDIVCNIIKGLLEGLSLFHDKNILHRDIKPANILIGNDYIPKYSDFGVSKMIKNSQHNIDTKIPHGEKNKALGTNKYMAPEVYEKCEYSKKADIYSLGLVFEEINEVFREAIPAEIGDFLMVEIIKPFKSIEPKNRPEIIDSLKKFNDFICEFNSNKKPFQYEKSSLKVTEPISYPEIALGENKIEDDKTSLIKIDLVSGKDLLSTENKFGNSLESNNNFNNLLKNNQFIGSILDNLGRPYYERGVDLNQNSFIYAPKQDQSFAEAERLLEKYNVDYINFGKGIGTRDYYKCPKCKNVVWVLLDTLVGQNCSKCSNYFFKIPSFF